MADEGSHVAGMDASGAGCGLKMATGIKYPRTRGYPTRWARIRVWVCARGRGGGYDSKPNGYFITGLKI